MPQNTPNLVLTCYDLTTDAGVYFSTFRSTLAGYTNSALTKIDTWAGTVNADLTALKQAPAIVRVSAIKADDFLYNATVVGLAQYTTGMYINLSLDVTNLGTVSLNINGLGGRSLLKVDSTGAFVNITQNDLRLNKNNLFTYNGTAWVWINAVSSDQLNVSGTALNLTRISANNTLEDAGVSFAPTVVNNGIPQRTATGQLKGTLAVANDDVVNKLYADTIDNKIGILSALTTIDKTSVVGAINENSSAIGQIADGGGYINTKVFTDFNLAIYNSLGYGYNALNMPTAGGTYSLTTIIQIGATLSQLAVCMWGGDGANKTYTRVRTNVTWSEWKEIATTESVTLTLVNGWISLASTPLTVSKSGKICSIVGIIQNGTVTENTLISTLPTGFKPKNLTFASIDMYSMDTYVVSSAYCQIDISGNITTSRNWTTGKNIVFNITFEV